MNEDLNLPAILMDADCIIKMITILFPYSTRMQFADLIHNVERNFIAKAFSENVDYDIREKLFTDPLIKHLWQIFVKDCPKLVESYIRRIRRHPDHVEL